MCPRPRGRARKLEQSAGQGPKLRRRKRRKRRRRRRRRKRRRRKKKRRRRRMDEKIFQVRKKIRICNGNEKSFAQFSGKIKKRPHLRLRLIQIWNQRAKHS
ncbi:unnamed protein product [Pleuronectes platessa]|uniref:Uncharacterized protein n=1 Tax=Pleuronectes platessa TaxID=8262 RepID=A0A9N7VQ22_PLEPL|nr:unnamed protein product [Pleuronectes platessa]